MSNVKIPKQLYVVSKKLVEREYIKPDYNTFTETVSNFGFLHSHEPKLKTDAKRKKTQHEWAYREYPILTIDTYQTEDKIWQIKGLQIRQKREDESYEDYRKITIYREEYNKPIPLEYAPRVWENEPLTGFMIVDTVNLYRGNKLFKVLDPRGIQFEVTVASLFEILRHGTITNGRILDACLWKGNKNLVIAK